MQGHDPVASHGVGPAGEVLLQVARCGSKFHFIGVRLLCR